MRILSILLVALASPSNSAAQEAAAEPTVEIAARWTKGQSWWVEVERATEVREPGAKPLRDASRTPLQAEVERVDKDGFVIRWTVGATTVTETVLGPKHLALAQSAAQLTRDLEVLVRCDGTGRAIEIRNVGAVQKQLERALARIETDLDAAPDDVRESLLEPLRVRVEGRPGSFVFPEVEAWLMACGRTYSRAKPEEQTTTVVDPATGAEHAARARFRLMRESADAVEIGWTLLEEAVPGETLRQETRFVLDRASGWPVVLDSRRQAKHGTLVRTETLAMRTLDEPGIGASLAPIFDWLIPSAKSRPDHGTWSPDGGLHVRVDAARGPFAARATSMNTSPKPEILERIRRFAPADAGYALHLDAPIRGLLDELVISLTPAARQRLEKGAKELGGLAGLPELLDAFAAVLEDEVLVLTRANDYPVGELATPNDGAAVPAWTVVFRRRAEVSPNRLTELCYLVGLNARKLGVRGRAQGETGFYKYSIGGSNAYELWHPDVPGTGLIAVLEHGADLLVSNTPGMLDHLQRLDGAHSLANEPAFMRSFAAAPDAPQAVLWVGPHVLGFARSDFSSRVARVASEIEALGAFGTYREAATGLLLTLEASGDGSQLRMSGLVAD
ncbi:MAG: hypothetical protein GY711_00760 [bacterium]|nr:hypothetical protein [bacterium]